MKGAGRVRSRGMWQKKAAAWWGRVVMCFMTMLVLYYPYRGKSDRYRRQSDGAARIAVSLKKELQGQSHHACNCMPWSPPFRFLCPSSMSLAEQVQGRA